MGCKQSSNNDTEIETTVEQQQQNQDKIQSEKKPKTIITLQNSREQNLVIKPADSCKSKIDIEIDGVRFWSTFDNGNLAKVEQGEKDIFKLWIAKDCEDRLPKLNSNNYIRQWFYFRVENKAEEEREIYLEIQNIYAKQYAKLWKADPEVYTKIMTKQKDVEQKWQRHPLSNLQSKGKCMIAGWKIKIEPKQKMSFAYGIPWSYTHNQEYITIMQNKFNENQEIQFNREILCKSFEGRDVDLITLTKKNNVLDQKEQIYGDPKVLFPEINRPNKYNKPYLLISCRVHAGEQPASYIMKGILEFLSTWKTNKDAEIFLENFVLILIPMLNPDGVYRGHQRLDALGYDLNRVYCRQYKKEKFPAQYALIETAIYYQDRIRAFIDLHAHSEISNAFLFSNKHFVTAKQVKQQLYPYFMKFQLDFFKLKPQRNKGGKQILKQEQLEGQYTEDVTLQQPDNHDWHPSKFFHKAQKLGDYSTNVQVEENKNQDIDSDVEENQTAFAYVKGFSGIAKSDVFYSTMIDYSYTLEANYRYSIINQGEQECKKKLGTKEFQALGQSTIISFLEIDQLRGERSILPSQGYQTLQDLEDYIASQI